MSVNEIRVNDNEVSMRWNNEAVDQCRRRFHEAGAKWKKYLLDILRQDLLEGQYRTITL